jgi:hypothetical protein
MSFLSRVLDERFFAHRRRSTSVAGMAGGLVALGLFAWRFYAQHVWSWDLFAVVATFVVVKVAVMAWSSFTD